MDGGTKEVLLDPALEDAPVPREVLLEPAVEPAEAVEFDPPDELELDEESESGKGGTAVPGDEALESGVAGAGEEALESGVEAAGLDAAGLEEPDSDAELEAASPAPGMRLLILLGRYCFSFCMSADNIVVISALKFVSSADLALPPESPDSMPAAALPDAVPAPVVVTSADGGEDLADGFDA